MTTSTSSLDDLMGADDPAPDDTVVRPAEESPGEASDESSDDLLEDELLLPPARTSRLTLVLVGLLVLLVGFLAGVQVERVLGGASAGRPAPSAASASASPTR